MKEYIEREAVIDLITRRYECPEICTAEINSIPAADVVERKRGRWETTMVAPAGELVRWTHVHKECGYLYTDLRTKGYNFCPNCGADMREGDHG